ncbi:hypothetical protein KP509_21G075600 [Ceratopteris richardii]|uniref:Uncharacterized protein n=1 Tax=Ceratopteris richardii TaxID=49495 RepID=A0A8T2SDH8_CERRI|nr:hypothetical protein KP509_21G075600 [Ceratopteris richardii]
MKPSRMWSSVSTVFTPSSSYAVLLIVAVLASWYVERWCISSSSNWVPLLFILWATIKYEKYRHKVLSEEINRRGRWTMEKSQPLTPLEPCEWLNKLLMDVWANYMEPKLSYKFSSMMMKKLKAKKPNFIESVEVQEFSLGLAPPAIGLDRIYWTKEENEQVLHTGFLWDTNEMSILIAINIAGPFKKHMLVAIHSLHIKGDLRVVPILGGRCALYSFESSPEVRVTVTFGSDSESAQMVQIPGISFLMEKLMLLILRKTMIEPQRSCFSLPVENFKKPISGKCSKKTQCCMEGDTTPNWNETFDVPLDGRAGSIHFNVLEESSRCSDQVSLGQCKVQVKCIEDGSAVFWALGKNNSSLAVISQELDDVVEMSVPLEGKNYAVLDIKLVVKQWLYSTEATSEGPQGLKDLTGRIIKVAVGSMIAKDDFMKWNPKILLQYGKTVRRTKTIQRDNDSSLNQIFEFAEVRDEANLKIKRFDANSLRENTWGTIIVNLDDIRDDEFKHISMPLENTDFGEINLRVEAIKSNANAKEDSKNGIIELVLIEARDLVAADLCGTSDPYVSVHYGKRKKRTKVVYKNLNPQWNQQLEFPDSGQVLKLHVRDENALLPSTSIGNCIVNYEDLEPNQTLDTWIPLLGVKKGEIHVKITRRFHNPFKISRTESVSIKDSLMMASSKISSILNDAFLAVDGESEQLADKIREMESLARDQDAQILQVLKEQDLLLSKISELEKVLENAAGPREDEISYS